MQNENVSDHMSGVMSELHSELKMHSRMNYINQNVRKTCESLRVFI